MLPVRAGGLHAFHEAFETTIAAAVSDPNITQTPDGDLCWLACFAPNASVFEQIALAQDLEDLLGVVVHVVTEGGLGERLVAIRTEACPL